MSPRGERQDGIVAGLAKQRLNLRETGQACAAKVDAISVTPREVVDEVNLAVATDHEQVGTRSAGQVVNAGTASQGVNARTAINDVVVFLAPELVVAVTAKLIVASAPEEPVVSAPTVKNISAITDAAR